MTAINSEIVVDGDDSEQWVLTGIHAVNRVCYLVTEIAHDWREIEFRIPARGYSLTALGLLRQTNKISRLMSMEQLISQSDRMQRQGSWLLNYFSSHPLMILLTSE